MSAAAEELPAGDAGLLVAADASQSFSSSCMSPPPAVDYLRPIIADGDTGHGGLTSVMRLTKLMVEAGAAAIHLEDQKPGSTTPHSHTYSTQAPHIAA